MIKLNVLVSGGLGFIGSNFIRYLLDSYRDIKIVNIDNFSYGSNLANLIDVENNHRYKFVKGDIREASLLTNLIKEIDVIVNIAAETHVDRSISNPKSFLENNTVGTFNLLETIRLYNPKVRFIQVSTDEVYSDILEGSYSEEDRLKPSSPYSASKAAADMFCLAYHRSYNLDIVITRCTNNFGPYQFPEKLIPKTIIRASMGMKTPIYGTGRNIRDWIYVLDHCKALDIVMNKGKSGEIYNVSSGNELENIELVKKILDIMGKDYSLIEFVEDRPGHDLRYSLDSSKIRHELNWRPIYSFDEALEHTVKWYLDNESWWRPLADEKVLHSTPWKLKW